MSPCVPSILCASWFAVVFSALTHHVRHGLAKRWCLPEWPEEGGEEGEGGSGGGSGSGVLVCVEGGVKGGSGGASRVAVAVRGAK